MKVVNAKEGPYPDRRAQYYDEAYLIGDSRFVGILTQELHNEPYMAIDLDEVDIMNKEGEGPLGDLLDFTEQHYKRPQITRASESDVGLFLDRGWTYIPNKDGTVAMLRNVRRDISPIESFDVSSSIRPIRESDLGEIEELFRREYPLRYRMVRYLYDPDKESNFAYEGETGIEGVTFNQRMEDYLYCRQIFVRADKRYQRIGYKLNQFRLAHARDHGLFVIYANVRGDVIRFHEKQKVTPLGDMEYYLIRNRE